MVEATATLKRPIGVFDSGLGGLTVLRELRRLLPNEDFIYLGDTARLPYGAKSRRIVQRYSMEVAEFLIQHNAKQIVIACNTATAHAEAVLREAFDVPVIGVIEPGVRALLQQTRNGRIGVIGTRSTIKSAAYTAAIKRQAPDLQVFARACPLFVPLVEEGWIDKRITRLVIQEYLSELHREEVDTIVLGCTHYPLLKTTIQQEFPDFTLIDSSFEVARAVQAAVDPSPTGDKPGASQAVVYLTDITDQMNHLETLLTGMNIDRLEETRL
ncbi:MAG: glutamate racemase [Leptospiraceae bacterium]|nr:glutamate racemase [Leptospiraceae bacterium]